MLPACFALVAKAVLAGGLAVEPQSASGVGGGFSSGAAAEDASTIGFNPAGMSNREKSTFTAVANILKTSFVSSDSGSNGAFGLTGTGNGGDRGGVMLVPQLSATDRLNDNWSIGIGIKVRCGLKTEYESDWRGQYAALKSEVSAPNIGPAVALRLNKRLSLAIGIDWQRFSGELTSVAGPLRIAGLKASDTACRFNTGLKTQRSANVRIGVAYRSALSYALGGPAQVATDDRLGAQ